MEKTISEMTLEELEYKRKSILSNCSGWMSCQDGSYEMALHYAGLGDVDKQIEKLKAAQE